MRWLAVSLVVAAMLLVPGNVRAAGDVTVNVDRTSIETALGRKFTFRSTLTNPGSSAVGALIAHLNVLSYDPRVYVDPEDWSSHRTRYLTPIPPGGSRTITWPMQAVNAGTFAVYVSVLPQRGAVRPPSTGPVIRVAVAERRTLNSGGILPLALGIPALIAVAWLALRLRRRPSRTLTRPT